MQRRSLALAAVVLGSGIVFLDSTVVNVALKAIGKDLPATFVTVLEGQSYIVNGYLLTLSALLILSGALADTYGRRRMFMIGLSGFGLSSIGRYHLKRREAIREGGKENDAIATPRAGPYCAAHITNRLWRRSEDINLFRFLIGKESDEAAVG